LLCIGDSPLPGVAENVRALKDVMGIKFVLTNGGARNFALKYAKEVLGWNVETLSEVPKFQEGQQEKEIVAKKEKENPLPFAELLNDHFEGDDVYVDWTAVLANREGAVATQLDWENKCKVVYGLKKSGFIVAVLANDPYILRAAHVSFVGEDASDSAGASASFIMKKDNSDPLGSLVKAIQTMRQEEEEARAKDPPRLK
jgi:hypothetical protein